MIPETADIFETAVFKTPQERALISSYLDGLS